MPYAGPKRPQPDRRRGGPDWIDRVMFFACMASLAAVLCWVAVSLNGVTWKSGDETVPEAVPAQEPVR